MSNQIISNYNKQMTKMINKAIKSGHAIDSKSFFELNKHFIKEINNHGSGICNCSKILAHPNGGRVLMHTCGYGIFNTLSGLYNANKKAIDIGIDVAKKRIGGAIDYVPQKKLKANGFGWGRQDFGDVGKLEDWAKSGIDAAETVGKIFA